MGEKRIFLIILVFLLLGGLVSAFSFSELFNKVTGRATSSSSCYDSDGGLNYTQKGVAFIRGGLSLPDSCGKGNNYLAEAYCNAGSPKLDLYLCPGGCLDGACVQSVEESNLTDSEGLDNFTDSAEILDERYVLPSPINCPEDCPVTFYVKNPTKVQRKDEVFRHLIKLEDMELHEDNLSRITVVDIQNQQEVLSDYIESSVLIYPNGFVREVELVIQDSFIANEKKDYAVRFDTDPLRTDEDLKIIRDGFDIEINNNKYDFSIDYRSLGPYEIGQLELNYPFGSVSLIPGFEGKHGKDNDGFPCMSRGRSGWEKTYNFHTLYGSPTKVDIEANKVMIRLEFDFDEPYEWRHIEENPADIPQGEPKKVDWFSGKVVVEIYKNRPEVYTYTKQILKKSFFTHAGFWAPSLHVVGGKDRLIFGYSEPKLIYVDKDRISYGSVVPRITSNEERFLIFTTNNEGKGSPEFYHAEPLEDFHNYVVMGNENNKGTLVYFPDYVNSVIRGGYRDRTRCYLKGLRDYQYPLNQLVFSGEGLSFIYCSTGPGNGWMNSEVPAATYSHRMNVVFDLPYNLIETEENWTKDYEGSLAGLRTSTNPEDVLRYKRQIELLKTPLLVNLLSLPPTYVCGDNLCKVGVEDIESSNYFCPSDCGKGLACGDGECKVGVEDNPESDFYCSDDCS